MKEVRLLFSTPFFYTVCEQVSRDDRNRSVAVPSVSSAGPDPPASTVTSSSVGLGQLRSQFTCDDAGVGKEGHRFQHKDRLLRALHFSWWRSARLRAGRLGGERQQGQGVKRHRTLTE